MKVRFLLDEHIPTYVADAIASRNPEIFVLQVGQDADAPEKRTLDSDVIRFAGSNEYALVSFDKRTLKKDADDFVDFGNRTWGVFILPDGNRLSAGRIADELNLIWVSSEAEEWIDRVEFLPL